MGVCWGTSLTKRFDKFSKPPSTMGIAGQARNEKVNGKDSSVCFLCLLRAIATTAMVR